MLRTSNKHAGYLYRLEVLNRHPIPRTSLGVGSNPLKYLEAMIAEKQPRGGQKSPLSLPPFPVTYSANHEAIRLRLVEISLLEGSNEAFDCRDAHVGPDWDRAGAGQQRLVTWFVRFRSAHGTSSGLPPTA